MELTKNEQRARKRLCLPLDGLETLEELKRRVEDLSPVVGLFKVGKEAFTRFGPSVVGIVHDSGSEVFLDLKYHDIPNTVRGAAKAAAELGVYMFNVHASGGLEMMKAALEGAKEGSLKAGKPLPKIIAVTILTSIDKETMNSELNIPGEVETEVLKLSLLAYKAGLDGVVCSAVDLYAIRDKLPKEFIFVTPGIKGPNTPAGADQKRVFTPANAIRDGATILVAGRTITSQQTKELQLQAGKEILEDMAKQIGE